MLPTHVILPLTFQSFSFQASQPDYYLVLTKSVHTLNLDFFSLCTKCLTSYIAWNSVLWNFFFPCYCLSSPPMNKVDINFPSIFYSLYQIPSQPLYIMDGIFPYKGHPMSPQTWAEDEVLVQHSGWCWGLAYDLMHLCLCSLVFLNPGCAISIWWWVTVVSTHHCYLQGHTGPSSVRCLVF